MALMKHASDYATLIGPTVYGLARHIGETGNTANPLHVLQTHVSKDSHAHNPHGVDETTVYGLARHIGETGNTANPLHVLQTHVSKDSHGHNPHGVDETCVRLRYANRTYGLLFQRIHRRIIHMMLMKHATRAV